MDVAGELLGPLLLQRRPLLKLLRVEQLAVQLADINTISFYLHGVICNIRLRVPNRQILRLILILDVFLLLSDLHFLDIPTSQLFWPLPAPLRFLQRRLVHPLATVGQVGVHAQLSIASLQVRKLLREHGLRNHVARSLLR